MTEATHQMSSNPLPPKQQKPGFVGMPAGPKICIMNNKNETFIDQSLEKSWDIKQSRIDCYIF